MTDSELKKIAAKISKCLALAASDNPDEAAAAKRQAEALMRKYNLTSGDVAASRVHEKQSKTGGKHRPPVYLSRLASIIATAFGCEILLSPGFGYQDSTVMFIGLGIKPELSAYTFDVLSRLLKNDRSGYLKTLKRYKRANKTHMADVFCQAWVWRISKQVHEFAGTEQDSQAIAAYKTKHYGDCIEKYPRRPAQAKRSDMQAFTAGHRAADDVSIHRPVQNRRNHVLGKA